MTLPKARLKYTSLRGLSQRELETEYNRIWEEIENEIKQKLEELDEATKCTLDEDYSGGPWTMPGTYSKYIPVRRRDGTLIGVIPVL